jgi:hypothetical protein
MVQAGLIFSRVNLASAIFVRKAVSVIGCGAQVYWKKEQGRFGFQRRHQAQDRDGSQMHYPLHITLLVVWALATLSLGGCASINEKLAAGMSDAIPQWAGGMPADAPPRPGTAKYDEFMRERERKRLEPAPAKEDAAKAGPSKSENVR